MKKIFAIVLGVLFVLSFAASAFAIHAEIPSETQAVVGAGSVQITLGGELRVRGWYNDNIDAGANPQKVDSSAWYDERVRLSVDAKVTPNVEGMVELETSNLNGASPHNDSYLWGNFDSKPDTLSILQAWIMYSGSGLLGVPSGMKIGHMPLALGQREFFDNTKYGDDAIVLFAQPTKELEADLLTIKFAENNILRNTDDLDGYVGILSYKLDDKNTIGLNYTYLNQSTTDFSLQNLELAGNGSVSGFGYKYSADVQFGKMGTNNDAKGWAIMAGLNYMLDPVNLRASFGYGTGDDTSNDTKRFVTFLGDEQYNTLVYDYSVQSAAQNGLNQGLSNTTLYNLGLDVAPVKDVKLSLDGYILRASKTSSFGPNVSKNVGWEIDGRVAYNVAKNLTYQVDMGYMHAGSFYKDLAANVSNPVVLVHSLTLSF